MSSYMGNLFKLHKWELNFGQTIRGKMEVLLGTPRWTIWELGEPFGNLMITDWEHIENKGRTQKIAPLPLLIEKNWSPHEGKLSLLIGSIWKEKSDVIGEFYLYLENVAPIPMRQSLNIFTKLFSKQQQQKHAKNVFEIFPIIQSTSHHLHHVSYCAWHLLNGVPPKINFSFLLWANLINPSPKKTETMETPQKRRLYFGVQLSDSPLSTQNTTWKNKNMSHHPREKKRTTLHFMARLSLVAWKFQFLKLVATIFGLNSPPSHVQLLHITFLWHGSTTWEPRLVDDLLFQWHH